MLKLYSYWRSSASYRVRIALSLKNVRYDYVPVNLIRDGGEQHGPGYRSLNPQGRVPLLLDGDLRLAQSMAILDYLESRYPSPPLVPRDPEARARMLAFCHTIVADIQPLQNTEVIRELGTRFAADEAARNEWVRHWMVRGLTALERERGAVDSAYVFGDAPTWADCVLVPQIYSVDRYGGDHSAFPRLYAIGRRLRDAPGFAAAHPDRQPDAPAA